MDFSRELTRLEQGEVPWLQEVSNSVITRSLDLDRAFQVFFVKRASYPRFERKGVAQAVPHQLDGRLKTTTGASRSIARDGSLEVMREA